MNILLRDDYELKAFSPAQFLKASQHLLFIADFKSEKSFWSYRNQVKLIQGETLIITKETYDCKRILVLFCQ